MKQLILLVDFLQNISHCGALLPENRAHAKLMDLLHSYRQRSRYFPRHWEHWRSGIPAQYSRPYRLHIHTPDIFVQSRELNPKGWGGLGHIHISLKSLHGVKQKAGFVRKQWHL